MTFNSYIFVFVFFPVFIIGMNLIRKTGRAVYCKLWLTAMSLIFFGAFGLGYIILFMASSCMTYVFARLIIRNSGMRKFFFMAAVIANIGILGFFKYAGFFAGIINSAAGTEYAVSIGLPLAISFYTFQQLSFLADIYSGKISASDVSIIDYAAYITFFPKILQGPIVRYNDIKSQLDSMPESAAEDEHVMRGLLLFIMGLAKKALLADTLGIAVDYGFGSAASLTWMDVIIVAVSYSFQIYFDFSGYCDMAQGVCRVMGLELPLNFNEPYKARNIIDFWKRWHITLTGFFTQYVYIPLGGNRRGKFRMYLNYFLIFFLSGFWHGAGWTFIIWGVMHGVLYMLTKAVANRSVAEAKVVMSSRRTEAKVVMSSRGAEAKVGMSSCGAGIGNAAGKKFISVISVFLTFTFVTCAWIFFRAGTISEALLMFKGLFRIPSLHISFALAKCFQTDELWYILKVTPLAAWKYGGFLCMWIILAVCAGMVFIGHDAGTIAGRIRINKRTALFAAIILVWCILTFANVSTFIYTNF